MWIKLDNATHDKNTNRVMNESLAGTFDFHLEILAAIFGLLFNFQKPQNSIVPIHWKQSPRPDFEQGISHVMEVKTTLFDTKVYIERHYLFPKNQKVFDEKQGAILRPFRVMNLPRGS